MFKDIQTINDMSKTVLNNLQTFSFELCPTESHDVTVSTLLYNKLIIYRPIFTRPIIAFIMHCF